jgi:hypothetical protein
MKFIYTIAAEQGNLLEQKVRNIHVATPEEIVQGRPAGDMLFH